MAILSKRVDDTMAAATKAGKAEDALDEMGVDDMLAHAGKEGKWARDAKAGIMDEGFFAAVKVSLRVKAPLQHLLHFCMKRREYGAPENLALLAWGKAKEICNEFAELGSIGRWADVLGAVVRRIIGRVESFPVKLLVLVKSDKDTCCSERIAVACELLDTPPAALHIIARKVVTVIARELGDTKHSGKLCCRLYSALMLAAVHWKAETQEIEGVNNMLQMMIHQAPNIHQMPDSGSGRPCLLGVAGIATSSRISKVSSTSAWRLQWVAIASARQ